MSKLAFVLVACFVAISFAQNPVEYTNPGAMPATPPNPSVEPLPYTSCNPNQWYNWSSGCQDCAWNNTLCLQCVNSWSCTWCARGFAPKAGVCTWVVGAQSLTVGLGLIAMIAVFFN